ncbi:MULTISPECIES: hypothetical protein [Chryseobacterium]|uniref:Uncharacterized protein n=2 Tax=Chryseobacterium TaxID=59732 RepID=A0A6N4XAC2_9FLAO|nr:MULTISPECIES: hypothetical protein [Chryseobacterium]CAA7196000.1 hypothetical protein CHRY9293_02141 [Chryseobacterium potabilaquae]CAA7389969.1 hypothetical protein CHRY9393_02265 [Chryseobacterium fistulae]
MKTKIRKVSDWKTKETTTIKNNLEILATHIAVIISTFIFALFL